ncbi:threonine/serine exporter family protein [Bacillus sp. AGMB 02131]|uniref:Threonine/serine exporter family protein n=1 Tax=Peribacillus faecalis TaxID=2772559 RepID=A0A927CXK2_9BACI|nr:threonine/serine exporter family protein [Peribacillus faecalis]MBD3109578.1 threonine/serine exporter family protein [Peribacillus faecalis]
MEKQFQYEVMNICLLAGKILLQNGAETYRVEDTMLRIAAAFGITKCDSFVIPTGIIFSIETGKSDQTKLVRVSHRTTDLLKVTQVNRVSRDINEGKLTTADAYALLQEIEAAPFSFSLKIQLLAAALASACFVIMFNGSWQDFLPALVTGGLGFLSFLAIHSLVSIKFVSEFLAAVVIGLVSYLFVRLGFGYEIDKIIIGSVMPLVPGLLITNAVRDLMAGHLVSSLSKGAEAFLTALAIGSGIAIVFTIV